MTTCLRSQPSSSVTDCVSCARTDIDPPCYCSTGLFKRLSRPRHETEPIRLEAAFHRARLLTMYPILWKPALLDMRAYRLTLDRVSLPSANEGCRRIADVPRAACMKR